MELGDTYLSRSGLVCAPVPNERVGSGCAIFDRYLSDNEVLERYNSGAGLMVVPEPSSVVVAKRVFRSFEFMFSSVFHSGFGRTNK